MLVCSLLNTMQENNYFINVHQNTSGALIQVTRNYLTESVNKAWCQQPSYLCSYVYVFSHWQVYIYSQLLHKKWQNCPSHHLQNF